MKVKKKITRNAMRNAWWGANLALLASKVCIDWKRHGGHDEHDQKCRCFAQCVRCTTGK
jgi:hypothetical protein